MTTSPQDVLCPCGHVQQTHRSCGKTCTHDGCHDCACDLRAFEVGQGSVRYADTGQHLSLADHLAGRGITTMPAIPAR